MPSGFRPSYPTPDKDFGYDVSDYMDVDPRFGTPGGLRPAGGRSPPARHPHRSWTWCSTTPPTSIPGSLNPAPARQPQAGLVPLESPHRRGPNNWQAASAAQAWEFDPATGQYYLHLFTKEQPDVNWRNPEVRQAQLDVFRFWLERGVDGFRLDVFNAYFKHADLPDNPPKFGLRGFDRQRHHLRYRPAGDDAVPERNAAACWIPTRNATPSARPIFATPEKTVSYCGPDRLHAAFSFDFHLHGPGLPLERRLGDWHESTEREQTFNAAGIWPTTVMSNHDLPRAASRYSAAGERFAGHGSPWPCC